MVSMVSTAAFSRIKASITFAILLATFIACGGTLIPDYGKTIYKSAEPVDYEKYEDQTGYPAGAGYEELTSREEIIEAEAAQGNQRVHRIRSRLQSCDA